MKKILFFLLPIFLLPLFTKAQTTKVVSTRQNYTRGTASAKFSDTTMVVITHDLEGRTIDFKYVVKKEPVYPDVKSLSIQLAFVDRESNVPGIYAETLDKEIGHILFYDGWIEIHYRNGNLSVFNDLKPFGKK